MLDVATSQLTTLRWELPREIARLAKHGFEALAVWRPKLSDTGAAAAAASLAAAGIRVSSLQWAGGFTGGDGRSFAESVADAVEAIEAASILGAATRATRPPILVVQSGCRGGHTRTHATRLLDDALEALVPVARREGVVLALEPLHAVAAPGCSFLAGLGASLDVVTAHDAAVIGIVLDLWHFGDDPALPGLLPRLAEMTALLQVADRCGPPSPGGDRLPAGHGTLPLERLVTELVLHGYRGDVEFDPVGETVEMLGYDGVLGETRLVADAWRGRAEAAWRDAGVGRGDAAVPGAAMAAVFHTGHFRRAGSAAGARRSQASSQAVSRG